MRMIHCPRSGSFGKELGMQGFFNGKPCYSGIEPYLCNPFKFDNQIRLKH
jgi:hypothetical protein